MADDPLNLAATSDEERMDMMEFTPEPHALPNPTHSNRESTDRLQMPDASMEDPDHSSDSFERVHGDSVSPQGGGFGQHRMSQTADALRLRVELDQLRMTMDDMKQENAQLLQDNERLQHEGESVVIDFEAKLDEMQQELESNAVETEQYRIRYKEMQEELHDSRSAQMDLESSDKEKKELLMRLETYEQSAMQMGIALNKLEQQNEDLKQKLSSQTGNLTQLQQGIMTLKREKNKLEKNYKQSLDRYEILQQSTNRDIDELAERVELLQRENDIYRQNLSKVEQEKLEMQNEFTEATMTLLHDEFNEAHDDGKVDHTTSLRLERVSATDIHPSRSYDHDGAATPEPTTPTYGATYGNRFASQTSLPDTSLLETLAENDDGYHHSRKNTVGSNIGYDVDPIKLKNDIRDILVNDIKTMISQEMTTVAASGGGGSGGGGGGAPPQLLQLPEKMEEILQTMKQAAGAASGGGGGVQATLDEETLTRVMDEFKQSMSEILKKDVVENINGSKQERTQFEAALNASMQQLTQNMGNNDQLNTLLKDAISSQMTVLQIALEQQIGNTVSDTVQDAIQQKVNESLREDIKQDMNAEIETIRGLLEKQSMQGMNEMSQSGADGDDKKQQQQWEQTVSVKLNECMENIMSGKIDGFMDAFRKEVIPEVQAVFETLNKSSYNLETLAVDDEKDHGNHSELVSLNNQLMQEIEQLKKEKEDHDMQLKEVATSKVRQVVTLQNLLDHTRDDNRALQFHLNKYQEKFAEIKAAQEHTVVNKMWTYWNKPTLSA
mmetsp:Transcript_51597/g.85492  ORF Transcript_51597/g.85492 Transcript_51597/m.85492 type:complete len:781 (-) Transcript_51597:289-2631(-)|eukprot:CAMPEP_0202687822 /NCGR_PEP_ID=MMETSP1385-20130828/3418_1 /ASSEMBLY_ACC=CAM_ASM_000861 /TAXON_ID=933848 /ORGANISM="Elphidium margaritaceum" /LENGTH=780 /DNA_ID=CAMNT_0049342671 /DNA_START=131 /DNA_END=2473 /DNA_ORIENTATION=-